MGIKVSILLTFLFLSLSLSANEFIVGVDSKVAGKVEVQIGLELTSSRCYDFTMRNFIPVPFKKTQVIRQTQTIDNDIAEYKFNFESGLCNYSVTGVFFYAETAAKKGNAVIRPIQDGNQTEVDLELQKLSTAGLVSWREWITTQSVPQVFINLR